MCDQRRPNSKECSSLWSPRLKFLPCPFPLKWISIFYEPEKSCSLSHSWRPTDPVPKGNFFLSMSPSQAIGQFLCLKPSQESNRVFGLLKWTPNMLLFHLFVKPSLGQDNENLFVRSWLCHSSDSCFQSVNWKCDMNSWFWTPSSQPWWWLLPKSTDRVERNNSCCFPRTPPLWAPFSLARCLVELTDNRPQNYTTSPEIYSINQLKPALSVLIRSAQSVTHAHTWVLCNRCFRMSGLLMAAVDPNPSSQSARNICTTSPAHSLSLSPSLIMTEQFRGRC